jgi:putative membrane-bound dehydrogenase-like protein
MKFIAKLAIRIVALGMTFILPPADGSLAEPVATPEAIEPSAAENTIAVPAGFRVELVAAEPLVRDPIALEFDEHGYAYVIELPPYNEHAKPGQKTSSSICRLEDSDGDGRFDKRTTFADDLHYCTGLFCYDGGLFVGDPPDLLYLRDTNGDGRADQREAILTGFGTAPAGESQLNSFRWGLDNRIHICTGLDGGEIRAANEPEAPTQNVRNRRLLLDPRTRTFELTSGGGQHGMSFDDWGRTYVCDNSHPIEEVVYDDRYIERNPHMSAPEATVNIGPGAGFTKLARVSPPETWRRIRTRLRKAGEEVDDTYEPGRTSGLFTSATGITIYRGDAWPEEFRGHAFVGEVANNLVYAAKLKTNGLMTISERRGQDSFSTGGSHRDLNLPVENEIRPRPAAEAEFLASTDTWSRPAQFAQGPDGAFYVLDMYRQLIEGVQWVPPQVLAHMDPTAGSDRGRIYRIVPTDFEQPRRVRLGDLSTESLVDQLKHANGWHRDTAARLLYERQDRTAIKPLRRLLAGSKSPQARLHSLYALDGLGELEAGDVLLGLTDSHPRVREHALRLAEPFVERAATVRDTLVGMFDDPDVRVRFQLAFSLANLPAARRDPALIALLKRDGADSWFRVAVQSSLGVGAAEFLGLMLVDEELRHAAHGQEFLVALARQIGRANNDRELRTIITAIDAIDGSDSRSEEIAKRIVVALLSDGTKISAVELMERSQGRTRKTVRQLLTTARTTALNAAGPDDSRLEAISMLGCGSFSAERIAFEALLAPQQPQPVQQAVLKTLGRFSDAAVVELLLAKWPGFTPGLRASAAELLLSRPAWAEMLLVAVEKNQVARGDFDPARVSLLKSHPSPKVRERATTVFSGSMVARRADVVASYRQALELSGDAGRGRGVFEKSCAACHELGGSGAAIGADLRAIRDRGAEAVLLNILDPNREVQPNFLTYVIVTVDGRALTGIITEETPNNLTIRQSDATAVAIARDQIDEMASTGLSYMPEGLEKEIDQQAMADLLAFLMSVESPGQAGSGK